MGESERDRIGGAEGERERKRKKERERIGGGEREGDSPLNLS